MCAKGLHLAGPVVSVCTLSEIIVMPDSYYLLKRTNSCPVFKNKIIIKFSCSLESKQQFPLTFSAVSDPPIDRVDRVREVGYALCEEESLCGPGSLQTPRAHLTVHAALRQQQVQRAGSAKHSSPCPGLSAPLVKEHLCSTTKSFWGWTGVGGRRKVGQEIKIDLQRVPFPLMCPRPEE